jgi:hypothetical protein
MDKRIPKALMVQTRDLALGIPDANGDYYQGWQVEALRQFWRTQDITFTSSPTGIHFGESANRTEAARARVAEIVAAFESSGVAQSLALGKSLH